MTSSQLLTVLCVGGATLFAVALLQPRGVPAPVVLVAAGLIIGFVPFVPDASLQPHVVLLGLLPLLAYDAAITSSPTAILRHARSIGVLAVVLVVATGAAVAVTAHWLAHLAWPMAFVLGTAVAPTDAVAATSVARRVGLPRRLASVVEGEALFNDATALVLYAAAIDAATTGTFSAPGTAGKIVFATVAGAAIGLAVGFVGRLVRRRIRDPSIEIACSIVIAYAAYLPAEAIGASGVLASVITGLYLGWHSGSGAFSARNRLASAAFWETLVFLVNAVLFVFVGLSFHTFTAAATGPVGRLVVACVGVVAVLIAVRFAAVWLFAHAMRHAKTSARGADLQDPRERLVVAWSGMRGAITLAAVLAIPTVTAAGQELTGRDDVIYLAFAVIIATLLVQGMTLPFLVARLRLVEHPAIVDAERGARLELVRAAIAHLDRADVDGAAPRELTGGLRSHYLARQRELDGPPDAEEEAGQDGATVVELDRTLRRELTALQRELLGELRRQGRIGVTTQRALEHELDLQDAAVHAPAAAH